MAKRNYEAGKRYASATYATCTKSQLENLRDRFIYKSNNITIYDVYLSNTKLENRIDFYCGVLDVINYLLKELRKVKN